MEGIREAQAAGLTPVKINCVVVAGTNEDEVVDFARFSRETGHEVRFIEYMPLDADQAWERAKVVPSAAIFDAIDRAYALVPSETGAEPAFSYRFADGAPGGIGLIASVTEPFCETCNRLRLTADGQLRACLFALDEVDLKGPLRSGVGDEEIEGLIRAGVWRKQESHRINHPDFVRPTRSMSMIGG
jgi:cyclic pyranopterin phosphate synthase